MPEYLCEDGPLGGQVFEWHQALEPGETVTFCVVDVAHPPPDGDPEADYRVGSGPRGELPGRLGFVGGRGVWDPPVPAGRPAVA